MPRTPPARPDVQGHDVSQFGTIRDQGRVCSVLLPSIQFSAPARVTLTCVCAYISYLVYENHACVKCQSFLQAVRKRRLFVLMSTRLVGLISNLRAFYPGVAGNLVSVQASRISTYLHVNAQKRGLPEGESRCVGPVAVFFGHCKLLSSVTP